MTLLRSEQLAICAGLTMGEGHVAIQIFRRRKYTNYQPRFEVTNTDKSILKFMSKLLRVKVLPKPLSYAQRNKEKWKPCFRCTLYGFKVLSILEAISPYIISPKWEERIEIVREYVLSRKATLKEKGRRFGHYTEKELALIKRLEKLNKRGKT